MINYYIKVPSENHYLYAKEIATLVGIYTVDKRVEHVRLVNAFLEPYCQPPLYYLTRNGNMKKVFQSFTGIRDLARTLLDNDKEKTGKARILMNDIMFNYCIDREKAEKFLAKSEENIVYDIERA